MKQAGDLHSEAAKIVLPDVGEPPASEPPTAQLEQARAAVAEARAAERDLAMLTERRNTLLQKIAQADDPRSSQPCEIQSKG
jgi:acyl-CoA reductase-like NAD-dependent aldehyde dehydrogenase